MRRLAAAVGLALIGQGCDVAQDRLPSPQAYLFEKGRYQAIYAPDGKILRLLFDGNGDRVADVVTLFGPNLKPSQVEEDSDGDGTVDHWEYYDNRGVLEKVANARRRPPIPDCWDFYAVSGNLERRELDEDGDERVDQIERFGPSGLIEVALDTDRDGRLDRWQEWKNGTLTAENVDTNGDGTADRRLTYNSSGEPLKLTRLN